MVPRDPRGRVRLLGAHALLGDEQHGRAHHQHAADDVEDGGAHAAGLGQLQAALVVMLTFSPGSTGMMLTILVPRAVLPASGIW